jgi:hypothetical protein
MTAWMTPMTQMKPSVIVAALLACSSATLSAQAPASVQRVSWLAGCWERRANDRVILEQWMSPAGRMMLGMSRTVRGDSTLEYEHLELVERGGKLAYVAHPSGQATATFPQRELTDSTIVFEDPAHDFPQRIGYQRRGADSVVAWIEGTMRGNNRRISFPYARVRCDAR